MSHNRQAREIPLSKGRVAFVDHEDVPLVQGRSWCAIEIDKRVYAVGTVNGRFTYLHRYLLNAPAGMYVDHRDGDGLNCRRSNLRLATATENGRNQRLSIANSSGYKGVSFDKRRNKWEAYITVSRRKMALGRFTDVHDAARAYDSAARLAFGEFACLNFPVEGEAAA